METHLKGTQTLLLGALAPLLLALFETSALRNDLLYNLLHLVLILEVKVSKVTCMCNDGAEKLALLRSATHLHIDLPFALHPIGGVATAFLPLPLECRCLERGFQLQCAAHLISDLSPSCFLHRYELDKGKKDSSKR